MRLTRDIWRSWQDSWAGVVIGSHAVKSLANEDASRDAQSTWLLGADTCESSQQQLKRDLRDVESTTAEFWVFPALRGLSQVYTSQLLGSFDAPSATAVSSF